MTEPVIRPRRDDDLPSCVRALAGVYESDGYPAYWPTEPKHWLTPTELLGVWVAANGPEVLGHVALTHSGPVLAAAVGLPEDQLAAVARLFVGVPARRGGLAGALLERAAQAAVEGGRRPVLEVESGAAGAIALYERAGWQFVCTATANWLTPAGEPAVVHTYLGPA
ncbi:GNAT family N-acetyltransferase [Kitasatospora sp. NPDC048407]|uniref:GNAT family N-acetyltransferase n=1 Tax=Kitasatospora sp. NPDC048407 TaxID=3364051 RepID=UPI00372036FA